MNYNCVCRAALDSQRSAKYQPCHLTDAMQVQDATQTLRKQYGNGLIVKAVQFRELKKYNMKNKDFFIIPQIKKQPFPILSFKVLQNIYEYFI